MQTGSDGGLMNYFMEQEAYLKYEDKFILQLA